MAIPKVLLQQIIQENHLKSAGDVYSLLKESFKDLLQELLEAELDVSLGYDKNEKNGIEIDNKPLKKMFYLASVNVMKKWTMRYTNWDSVLSQLSLLYSERLKQYL